MKRTKLLMALLVGLVLFFMIGGFGSLADRNRHESKKDGAGASGIQQTYLFASPTPSKRSDEAKEIEKATGYKVNWKQFGGGGEVIKAMASGAVQIGEVGSAGIAAAVNTAVSRLAGLLAVAVLPLLAGMAAADPESLAAGFPRALWICAAVSAAGGVCALVTLRS